MQRMSNKQSLKPFDIFTTTIQYTKKNIKRNHFESANQTITTNINYKRRASRKEEAAPTWKELGNIIVEAADVVLLLRGPLFLTLCFITTARFLEPCSFAEHKRIVSEKKKQRKMTEKRIMRLALISPIYVYVFCLNSVA